MISPSQRSLTVNTQHSQQTNIHALGGIQIHDGSRRAAVDLDRAAIGTGTSDVVVDIMTRFCARRPTNLRSFHYRLKIRKSFTRKDSDGRI